MNKIRFKKKLLKRWRTFSIFYNILQYNICVFQFPQDNIWFQMNIVFNNPSHLFRPSKITGFLLDVIRILPMFMTLNNTNTLDTHLSVMRRIEYSLGPWTGQETSSSCKLTRIFYDICILVLTRFPLSKFSFNCCEYIRILECFNIFKLFNLLPALYQDL